MHVGTDGRWAPATIDGLPYLGWLGLTARLGTDRGLQLMRPAYGVDYGQLVDREVPGPIQRAVRQAVRDLDVAGVELSAVEVTVESSGVARVAVRAATS